LSATSSAVPAPGKITTAASNTTAASAATAASPTLGPAGEAARKPYMGWSSYSMQVYSPNGGS
jgi:hypothetical protein